MPKGATMRRKIQLIDKPSLRIHIDYEYLTVGELGNILIRLQAALRSIAGLSPGEYSGEYAREQPRFITSFVNTEKSIEIGVVLAVLAIVMQLPQAIPFWRNFTAETIRRFKLALLALVSGEGKTPEDITETEGLRIEVTRGKIDFAASRRFLQELTEGQRNRLANFLWSLTGPSRKVSIGDEESEISIYWPEYDDDKPKD